MYKSGHPVFSIILSASFLISPSLYSATNPNFKPPQPPVVVPQPEPQKPLDQPKPPSIAPKPSSMETESVSKDESSKIVTVEPAREIVQKVGWDNVDSWWSWFLDSSDQAYVDRKGNLYGGVISKDGHIYGDPARLNCDEEGQAITQKLIELYLTLALEGYFKTVHESITSIEGTPYVVPRETGPGYIEPKSGGYISPKVGSGYIEPKIGPGYVEPGKGGKYGEKFNELEKEAGVRVYGEIPLMDASGKPRVGWGMIEMPTYGLVEAPNFGYVDAPDYDSVGGELNSDSLDLLLKLWIWSELASYFESEYYQDIGVDNLINFLFQDGKILVNRRGNFVRFQEDVTYPAADTYKLTSITKEIGGQEDTVVLLVKANKQIDNVSPLPNLWSNTNTAQVPEYYALQQRLTISNGSDTLERIYLDGQSKLTTDSYFLNGQFNLSTRIYKTFFDHIYEFINGNAGAIDRMWDTSFRPTDNNDTSGGQVVSGMMWHLRPVLVETRLTGGAATDNLWEYTFVNGSQATGRMDLVEYTNSSKLSHYVNYVDSDGDGKLSSGEYYYDDNGDGDYDSGVDRFLDKVQLGFSGATDATQVFNATGDSTLFSDTNGNGLNDDGNSRSMETTVSASLSSWATSNRWAYLNEERLLMKDDVANRVGTFGVNAASRADISELFRKYDMERVFTSSKFGGRTIDVFVTPNKYMDAELIELKIDGSGSESIDQR